MDGPARLAFLAGTDATHPEAAPILRRMLVTHERAERGGEMETVPRLVPSPGWSSTHAPGATIGPFELIRPLGHGGMGEVWLARQVDGRVRRDVALKLPALYQQGEVWRERFRRERDILAKLEHPHIARLYDAGITEAGQPWLAMEYVEGLTLSAHVASRAHSIPERLALFRQVLDAVAHAHRHLVVHRDLKPANILIDLSGEVKLLDFGIAKLVDEGEAADALTRLGGRVMTLRYAAPEQVSAGTITTAIDIYALGVILHELLTGLSPYRAVREGKPLTDVMLLQEQVALPSRLATPKKLARLLAGDLDAIVLKALRRDPAERYVSVEPFNADILAHLEKRPVKARAGTWRYLAGRFAVRHKLPLGMAAAVLVTLLAGIVMAERERRVAVAEKARAERHFASVRKLANTFVFDVHSQLETLAGSLKARETLLKSSLEYLDALATEAGNDPGLMYELAVGYRKIGNIQGQQRVANIGDVPGAMRNFEKARALFVAVEAARPKDAATLREHWKLSYEMARTFYYMSDLRWKGEIATMISLGERLAALPGATTQDRSLVASALCEGVQFKTRTSGFNPEVEADVARGIGLYDALVAESPTDVDVRMGLARCHNRAGGSFGRNQTTPQSLQRSVEHFRKAQRLTRDLSLERPTDEPLATLAAAATAEVAAALSLTGEDRQADEMIIEALKLNAAQRARDPINVELAVDRIGMLQAAARIAYHLRDYERTIRNGRDGLATYETLPQATQQMRDAWSFATDAKRYVGEGLLASVEVGSVPPGRQREALLESHRMLAEVIALYAGVRARKTMAIRDGAIESVAKSLERCDKALARLAKS